MTARFLFQNPNNSPLNHKTIEFNRSLSPKRLCFGSGLKGAKRPVWAGNAGACSGECRRWSGGARKVAAECVDQSSEAQTSPSTCRPICRPI